MRPCIEKLNADSDFDVRYYASEAAMGTFRKFCRFVIHGFSFQLIETFDLGARYTFSRVTLLQTSILAAH